MPTINATDQGYLPGQEFQFEGEWWRVGSEDQTILCGGKLLKRVLPLFCKGGMVMDSPVPYYITYAGVVNVTSD